MDDDSGRLVHDYQRVVLVDNAKGNILRLKGEMLVGLRAHHGGPDIYPIAWLGRKPVYLNSTIDELSGDRSAYLEHRGERLVDSLSV